MKAVRIFATACIVAMVAAAAHAGESSLPDDGSGARTRAQAYLDAGNRLWAAKVLLERLDEAPGDLETRTWAVWVLLQDGDVDRARHLMEGAEPPETGPLRGRIELLEAALSHLEGDPESAAEELWELTGRDHELFAEDLAFFDDLRADVTGNPANPISARALLDGGYATNAVQSAPQDVGTGLAGAGAPIVSLDLVLRLEPWTSPQFRPLGELRGRGFAPLSDEAAGLAFLDLAGRAGVEFGPADGARLRMLYSYEQLGIRDRGWFMVAHRGEIEADVGAGVQLFGGVGRRVYEHLPRTRTELDAGVALVVPMAGGWNITGIAAGRLQQARHEAFHDRGLTVLLRVRIPLPRDFMVKVRGLVSYDAYPYSEDYYGGHKRRDGMVKVEAGPWTPPLRGLRVGLAYALAHRMSTADSSQDSLAYTDHRFTVQLRWQGAFDPTRPRRARSGDDHLPLPFGTRDGDEGLDRVQDLLRQEDSARRGSQCVD